MWQVKTKSDIFEMNCRQRLMAVSWDTLSNLVYQRLPRCHWER